MQTLQAEVLDALETAILVWQPNTGQVEFTNRVAAEHGLGGDSLAATVADAASEYREQWPCVKRSGIQPPALRFRHASQQWYLRTYSMACGFELITCSLEVVRESRLISGMQLRYRLTDRQADVLRYLLRGMTTRGTAEALRISAVTVRHHRRALLEALGVASPQAAMLLAEALRRGSS